MWLTPLLFYECPFEHHIDEFRTEEGEEILFILCDACLVKKKAIVIIAFKALIMPHRESTKKYKPRNEWGGKAKPRKEWAVRPYGKEKEIVVECGSLIGVLCYINPLPEGRI